MMNVERKDAVASTSVESLNVLAELLLSYDSFTDYEVFMLSSQQRL